ncbi:hypothetical protein ACI2JN_10835 [Ochrobactrum teleogrylli]|uniref:hypothetical protein n=2 Tax=Brucellaceae TaxID=118882 RepID=UPI003850CAC3
MSNLYDSNRLGGLSKLVTLIWPSSAPDTELALQLNARVIAQLNTPWGLGLNSYRQPPFQPDAIAAAGWQDPRSPRDFVVELLRVLDRHAWTIASRFFSDLDNENAQSVLLQVLGDKTASDEVASKAFALIRQVIYDALFVSTAEHKALGWQWLDQSDARTQPDNRAITSELTA